MNLTDFQKEKFKIAAELLKENQETTVRYADRSKGITNGDSERKKSAIKKLIGK